MKKCKKCGGKEFIVKFVGELLWNAETDTFTIWDFPDRHCFSEVGLCANPDCGGEIELK